MTILAIDPGFGRCGVAVLRGSGSNAELLYSACIETPSTDVFTERMRTIANRVTEIIHTYTPELIALEELYFSNNQKTVFHVSEIRGMLIYLALSRSIPLVEYNPTRIKIALTGYGRASKEQVITMVNKLIRLPHVPARDDEYDAIALGLTALAEARHTALSSH